MKFTSYQVFKSHSESFVDHQDQLMNIACYRMSVLIPVK